MLFYSLNHSAPKVNFKEATIKGQAPDKGLYFPQIIPQLPVSFFRDIEKRSKEEIALQVIQPYVDDVIPVKELERIVSETIAFNFPLVQVQEQIFSLELFHGPTLAFKDVGARFMSRCLGYFLKDHDKKVTVLVATSGDTGGAVANGFYGVDGVDVVILYPSGKVSHVQELQLTTLGKNITTLEIDGNFDDCQQMVKQAFGDTELNRQLFLTSANSINVARWLPQQFYYFFAYQQWKEKDTPPVICVPSGNFGNICAGIIAHHSGLPVQHFIAACNANDIVPQYMQCGSYAPKEAVPTLSNAMDVGNPSNFIRILELFNQKFDTIKKTFCSYSISDTQTKDTLKRVYEQHQYLLDPHGAVAYTALEAYLKDNPGQKGYFIETAHPVKFQDAVEPLINQQLETPAAVKDLFLQKKQSIRMRNEYTPLKDFLLEKR